MCIHRLRQEGEQNAELKTQLAALQKANAMLEEERAMVEEEKRTRVERVQEENRNQLRHSVSTDMALAGTCMRVRVSREKFG
jgi:cell division protein FtsB